MLQALRALHLCAFATIRLIGHLGKVTLCGKPCAIRAQRHRWLPYVRHVDDDPAASRGRSVVVLSLAGLSRYSVVTTGIRVGPGTVLGIAATEASVDEGSHLAPMKAPSSAQISSASSYGFTSTTPAGIGDPEHPLHRIVSGRGQRIIAGRNVAAAVACIPSRPHRCGAWAR